MKLETDAHRVRLIWVWFESNEKAAIRGKLIPNGGQRVLQKPTEYTYKVKGQTVQPVPHSRKESFHTWVIRDD